jgi:hypothetical protein
MDDREVNWGTHTIPQWNPDIPVRERNLANSNWTSGKPPLRKDEAFRERRRVKAVRHEKNKEAKAEANRTRSSNQGRR